MNFYIIAIIILIEFLSPLYSKDFRFTYPGTRANSIGTAFSSIADDPYTIFYNPAGLNNLKDWQGSSNINRKLSKKNMGEFSLVYVKPIPELKDGVFGFGYDAVRQSVKGKMDNYIFSYSNQKTLKYLQMPVLYGISTRITSIRYPYKSHLGIGFDAGILLSSIENYRFSAVISRFMFGMGEKLTTLTFGSSYYYRDTTFSIDLRTTSGYAELFYGIETKFHQDLIRIRAGKGDSLDGRDFIMFGAGINIDPLIIDLGFSYPYKGFHLNAGNYGVSITYKFTGINFYDRMYNESTQKIKELSLRSDALKQEVAALEKGVKELTSQKNTLETDLTIMNTRIIELQEKIKEKENEIADLEYLKNKKIKQPSVQQKNLQIQSEEKWPKLHKVEKGDTLRSISSKYYGTPDMWKLIYEENEDKILRGIPVEGEILVIPPPKKI